MKPSIAMFITLVILIYSHNEVYYLSASARLRANKNYLWIHNYYKVYIKLIIRLLYNYFAIMMISFRGVDIGIFTLNMKGYL